MSSMMSLPSLERGAVNGSTHLNQEDGTSAVLKACQDTLAALAQYSAILLDDRDMCSASVKERAALIDLKSRIKMPCSHRCESLADIHAKSVVYHALAEWFPPHDLDLYATDLIGEVSAFLEREHFDSGLAAWAGGRPLTNL